VKARGRALIEQQIRMAVGDEAFAEHAELDLCAECHKRPGRCKCPDGVDSLLPSWPG
jgi:hypothetical protein